MSRDYNAGLSHSIKINNNSFERAEQFIYSYLGRNLTDQNYIQDEIKNMYRGADKFLARLTSRCILFDGENISFYASLVIYSYT